MTEEILDQNLEKLDRLVARRTGDLLGVLDVIHRCEELQLSREEKKMAEDIAETINENSGPFHNHTLVYLVRFGMLLERGKESSQ